MTGRDGVGQQGPSSPDIAAQFLAWILSNLSIAVDQNALGRQLSLLFIGILISVNIRVVLRECLRVSRRLTPGGLRYIINPNRSF